MNFSFLDLFLDLEKQFFPLSLLHCICVGVKQNRPKVRKVKGHTKYDDILVDETRIPGQRSLKKGHDLQIDIKLEIPNVMFLGVFCFHTNFFLSMKKIECPSSNESIGNVLKLYLFANSLSNSIYLMPIQRSQVDSILRRFQFTWLYSEIRDWPIIIRGIRNIRDIN